MRLTVIDESRKLLSYSIDVVETWKSHVSIKICCSRAWMYAKDWHLL